MGRGKRMGRTRKGTTTPTGGVSTNYGSGTLADGTGITYLGDVVGGVLDKLNATVQTPTALAGRRVTRTSTATNVWSLV